MAKKTAPKKAAPEPVELEPVEPEPSGIALDPPTAPFLPGDVVTFVADDRDGDVMVRFTTPREAVLVQPSRNAGQARAARMIEGPDPLKVEFLDGGVVYASWERDL